MPTLCYTARRKGFAFQQCALGTGWNERKFHALTQHFEQHLDGLDEAQVYTILEIYGALDSQSKAKQDFIDKSRK